ncbi:MAG: branched-chain amino acid ABC transporter permease [Anaerolineaceae bacterium]|nr:MAG: branched-chain amino acid ABC transporter permease [Anaerolineaceae bacterium]
MKPSSHFWAGVRAELPLLIGVFPFGMIYGTLSIDAGIPLAAAQAMSSILFAGSSQFAFAQLVHESTPALVIVLTIAVINLRHVLYSASLAPHMHDLSMRWKILLSYLMTDEAYAVAVLNYERVGGTAGAHYYFLGAGLALWTSWQISTALGLWAGASLPATLSLDFALPLTFIAMVVPALRNRPAVVAALSAGLVALLTFSLPYKLGLILAALTGIVVGTILESRVERDGIPLGERRIASPPHPKEDK